MDPGEKGNNWWKEDRVGVIEIRLSQHPFHPYHHPTLSSPSYLPYLGVVSPGLVGACNGELLKTLGYILIDSNPLPSNLENWYLSNTIKM